MPIDHSIPVNASSSTPNSDTRPGPRSRGTARPRTDDWEVRLPAWWLQDHMARFTGSEFMVYVALLRFAKPDGTCFPEVPTLAGLAGLSDRQVQRDLRRLEAKGDLITKKRRSTTSKRTSNLYRLTRHPNLCDSNRTGDRNVTPPVTEVSPHGCHSCHPELDPENKIQENYTPPTPSLRSDPPPEVRERVREKAQVSWKFFPTQEEDQERLRAEVLTPELGAWASAQGIHLDLASQCEHWLNDGISHGRRSCDFQASFKSWLQMPWRSSQAPTPRLPLEERQQRAQAAKRRFLEEDWWGGEDAAPAAHEDRGDVRARITDPSRLLPAGETSEKADEEFEELKPLLRLPCLAEYAGTPLDNPAWWYHLCPDHVSDRYTFFSQLADRLTHSSSFQGCRLHPQVAATFIKDEVYRLQAVYLLESKEHH